MKQESEYIKKIKRRMIIIGILVVTVFTTISFGFYYMGASQRGESGVSSITCFDMDFKDGDSINLTNAVSISDEMGLKTNPYHFELSNNCDTAMNYYVILNVKENSFSDDLISVSLDGRIARVLSTRPENTKFDKPTGYSKSYILKKGVINKDTPISYDARLWINADATYEQVQGKSWEAQIKVVSTVKELEDEILAQGIPNEMMARVDDDKFWQHSSSIKTVTFEKTLNPKENATYTYDVSELQDGSVMSYLVPNAEDNTKYDLYIQANGNVIGNPNCSQLFHAFGYLEIIKGLSNFDTSKVIDMSDMFRTGLYIGIVYGVDAYDNSLKEISEINTLNTSSVINMSYMFCSENSESESSHLTTLDVSNFDTNNVTDMSGMFSGCSNLTTLDLSNFDTSKVANMSGMFSGCSSLTTLDLSNFDTSNVTNMAYMFRGCSSLTTLDLSNFDTNNVTTMYEMFDHCSGLITLDLNNFDTNNVTNMAYMFFCCTALTTLDISNFDTNNVTNMHNMFYACQCLTTTITIRGTKCTFYSQMFIVAATAESAQITVNYTEDASTLVDNMIATKSSNSNVVKGTQVA